MNTIKIGLSVITFLLFGVLNAQEKKEEVSKETKTSYYKKRAKEDAKFEQKYKATSKKDEKKFWKEQKEYEKDLKKKDKLAYEAYMQGKRDAYAEHKTNCNHHCDHGHYYHSHASFYYHYEYRSKPRYRRNRTTVRLGVPSVRIGLF